MSQSWSTFDPTSQFLWRSGTLHTLQTLMRLSGSLSLCGSIAVIVHVMRNQKNLGGMRRSFIVRFTLADLALVPGALLARAVVNQPAGCLAQGVLVEFSMVSSILWAALTATDVLLSTVFHVSTSRLNSLEIVYHFVVWSAAAVAALAPPVIFLNDAAPYYGDAQFWCWIGSGHPDLRVTTLYLLAFVPAWSFGIANRVRSFIWPTAEPLPALFLLHGALLTAQGLFNAIVYFAAIQRDPFARHANLPAPAATGSGQKTASTSLDGDSRTTVAATGSAQRPLVSSGAISATDVKHMDARD
ncbi:hypothetical protein RI367_003264 [Sorochytrium milnesiophthora]